MNKVFSVSGIGVAIAALWLVGWLFCNSPSIQVYHPELDRMAPPEGCLLRWKTEGRGVSRYGRLGVSAVEDIRAVQQPKVILWGDSYVQALQVDDEKKMAQQVNRILSRDGKPPVFAVGEGQAGQSVADYLLGIRQYEAKLPPVAAHVVVVGQLEDLFPDQPSASYARLVSKPDLRILPGQPWNPSRAKWLAYEWGTRVHANGLLAVLRRYSGKVELRFQMGPHKFASTEQSAPPGASDVRTWLEFLAREFRDSTRVPLVLVFLPHVPRLEGNGWTRQEKSADVSAMMRQIFTDHGWSVIDMGDRFVRNFDQTGRLPRGFNNSKPDSGHLNQEGHRLVSEALAEQLRSLPAIKSTR